MLQNKGFKKPILMTNLHREVEMGKPDQLSVYQEKDHHGHKEPAVPKRRPYWNNRYKLKRRQKQHLTWHLYLSAKTRGAYSSIYNCRQRQVIKYISAIPPGIGISILPLALIIKTVHLKIDDICHQQITSGKKITCLCFACSFGGPMKSNKN